MSVSRSDDSAGLSNPELAALAKGMLMLDDARLYGFLAGGPKVDRDHCEAVLERLAREGIVPTEDEAAQMAAAFVAQHNAEREEVSDG